MEFLVFLKVFLHSMVIPVHFQVQMRSKWNVLGILKFYRYIFTYFSGTIFTGIGTRCVRSKTGQLDLQASRAL